LHRRFFSLLGLAVLARHYAILGVDPNATLLEIKQSYNKKILQAHPDKASNQHQEDSELFQKLQNAWQVLQDPIKRKIYDAKLSEWSYIKKVPILIPVDIDDMTYDEVSGEYLWPCRCGHDYIITEDQLTQNKDTVSCSGCSLCIQVLYDIVEENDPPS